MSETKKGNYEMGNLHFITDGKVIEGKPVYDKNGNKQNRPIKVMGPKELEKVGYVTIPVEPTIKKEVGSR